MHRAKASNDVRIRGVAVIAVVAAVVAGTLSSSCFFDVETQVCAVSGLRCPLGWACSADQKSCIQGGCGDGAVTATEVCDDGNITGGDGCSADCMSDETCGNGVMDPGETCDDGRNDDGDACSAKCVLAACGNVSVDLNEQCDPGVPEQDTESCDKDCTFIMCGDGYPNMAAGEECDTGDPARPDDPDPDTAECNGRFCKESKCGDSVFNAMAGEACDTGGDSQACNGASPMGHADARCQIPRCGDSYANTKFTMPGTTVKEECDTGGTNAPTCDFDCTMPVCGDGIENSAAGEECDDDNMSNADFCVRNSAGKCRDAKCGDGFRRTQGMDPEECDDGNNNTEDNCPSGPAGTCRDAFCGDGYINVADGESCDPKGNVGCTAPKTCVTMGPNECKACI